MSVGVQGKACGEVPQHAGYRLDTETSADYNGIKRTDFLSKRRRKPL